MRAHIVEHIWQRPETTEDLKVTVEEEETWKVEKTEGERKNTTVRGKKRKIIIYKIISLNKSLITYSI